MIEQSMVHLPELLKDIARPVSIYLVFLSSACHLSITKEPATDNPRTYVTNFGDRLTLV
jgi:hypothetical protein